MVGFFRRKSKADKVLLSDETALDRKGKVDGSRLLDENGDPTEGTLFRAEQMRNMQRRPSQENDDANVAGGAVPPAYPSAYGQAYPPQQSFGYPAPAPALAPAPAYGSNQGSYGPGQGPFGRAGFGPSASGSPYGANQAAYPPPPNGYDQGYPQQYGNAQGGYAPQSDKKKKSWFSRGKK